MNIFFRTEVKSGYEGLPLHHPSGGASHQHVVRREGEVRATEGFQGPCDPTLHLQADQSAPVTYLKTTSNRCLLWAWDQLSRKQKHSPGHLLLLDTWVLIDNANNEGNFYTLFCGLNWACPFFYNKMLGIFGKLTSRSRTLQHRQYEHTACTDVTDVL